MSFPELFLAASSSVATVGCTAAIGAYGAWRGCLTPATVKQINKIVQEIFTPAMVLYKVTANVSLSTLAMIGPMGLMCFVVVSTGLALGSLVSTVLSPAYPEAFPYYKGLLMVALAFPNSFSVPLTLQLALVDQPVFHSAGTPTAQAVHDETMSLYLFSYVMWIFMRWSVGYPVLAGGFQDFKAWKSKVVNPVTVACIFAVLLGLLHNAAPGVPTGWLGPLAAAVEIVSRALVPTIQLTIGAKLFETVTSQLQRMREVPYQPMDGTVGVVLEGNNSSEMEEPKLEIEPAELEAAVRPGLPCFVYALVVLLRQV